MHTVAARLACALALALATLASACATDDDAASRATSKRPYRLASAAYAVPRGPAADTLVDHADEYRLDAIESIGPQGPFIDVLGLGEPLAIDRGVCTCHDNACVAKTMRRDLGCGFCVDLACADGQNFGVCVPCAE